MSRNGILTNVKVEYIFAFLFPIIPLYFNIFGFNVSNLVCLLLVFGAILREKGVIRLKINIYAVFSFISLWITCRCFESLLSGEATEIFYILLRTVGIYIALDMLINTRKQFLDIIKAVIYSSGIVSVVGIVEEITHFNLFSLLTSEPLNYNPSRFGILRILTFSSHTIVYGVYLMFCLALCLYFMQFVSAKQKRKYQVIYGLLWINLILTLSRSIIILTIISQLMILYFCGVRKLFSIMFRLIIVGSVGIIVLSLISSEFLRIISYIWYMILAVFDDRYVSMISGAFGNDNLNAVGNRVDLYKWVAESMNNHWLLGNGMNASFNYGYLTTNGLYTWTQYKTSIEVHWLDILFRYGLVGLCTEALAFITIVIYPLLKKLKKREWEKTVGFNAVCFSAFVCYIIELFAVNQSSDRNIFYLFVILLFIYNKKEKLFNKS